MCAPYEPRISGCLWVTAAVCLCVGSVRTRSCTMRKNGGRLYQPCFILLMARPCRLQPAGWQQICNGRQEQMETPLWFEARPGAGSGPARVYANVNSASPASRHHWPARGPLSGLYTTRRRMQEDTQQSTRRERQSPHLACRTRGRSKRCACNRRVLTKL